MTATARKILKISGIALGALVLVAIAGALLLPAWIDVDALRPRLQALLRERVGREVSFSSIEVSILPTAALGLEDLVVAGQAPGADPWVTAKSARVRVKLRPLLSGRIEIIGVSAESPDVRVLRGPDGRVNILELGRGRGGSEASREVSIGHVKVTDAHVVVLDAAVEPGVVRRLEIAGLDLEATDLGTASGDFEGSGRILPSGGTISFDGTLGGRNADGHVTLDSVDLAALSPWLEPLTGMSGLAGRVSADMDVARREDGSAMARGPLSVSGLLLPIAAVGEPALDAKVDVDLDVAPGANGSSGATTIRRMELSVGATKLQLSGSVTPQGGRQDVAFELARSRVQPADLRHLARAFGQELPIEGLSDGEIEVATKVLVTREGEPRRVSRVAIDGLDVNGGRLRVKRANPGAGRRASAAPAGPALVARGIRVRGLQVELLGDAPLSATDVELTLDSFAPGQPGPVEGSATIAGGRVSVRGQARSAQGDSGLEVDVDVDLQKLSLAQVAPLVMPGMAAKSGTLSGATHVRGRVGGGLDLKGGLKLERATLALPSGRDVTLDMPAALDLRLEPGGVVLVRSLALELPGGTLPLEGRTEPGRLDLRTKGAATLSPEAVAWLLALAGTKLPFGLETEAPLEVDARVVRAGEALDLSGRAVISKARVTHPALPAPLDVAHARVTLEGDRVSVQDATLRLGRSALAGSLAIEDFDSPRLAFDLESSSADLDELFAMTSARSEAKRAAARGEPSGAPAKRMRGGGRLRIASATFKGLALTDFDAQVALEDGVLRIDPSSLALYGGRATSTARFDLADDVRYDVDLSLQDVDVEQLLSSGLAYRNLSGTGDAHLRLAGAAGAVDADGVADATLGAVRGAGDVRLVHGTLRGLDALGSLQRASVFGERSLSALASRLAADGTAYDSLAGRFAIADGRMTIEGLEARTADFDVKGSGTCGLLSKQLDLDVTFVFSEALSGQLRDEGSRAAQVFWDGSSNRVVLPARLTGPVSAPTAGIDWGAAAARQIQQRSQDALSDAIGGLLGGGRSDRGSGRGGSGGAPGGTSAGGEGAGTRTTSGVERAPGDEAPSDSASPPAASGALGARVDSLGFGGSVLAPSLKLKATLTGVDLSHAVVVVKDSGGREIQTLPEAFKDQVAAYYATAAADTPASIPVKLSVDGKLLLGSKRVVVTVRPVTRSGQAGAEIRAEAERSSLF